MAQHVRAIWLNVCVIQQLEYQPVPLWVLRMLIGAKLVILEEVLHLLLCQRMLVGPIRWENRYVRYKNEHIMCTIFNEPKDLATQYKYALYIASIQQFLTIQMSVLQFVTPTIQKQIGPSSHQSLHSPP